MNQSGKNLDLDAMLAHVGDSLPSGGVLPMLMELFGQETPRGRGEGSRGGTGGRSTGGSAGTRAGGSARRRAGGSAGRRAGGSAGRRARGSKKGSGGNARGAAREDEQVPEDAEPLEMDLQQFLGLEPLGGNQLLHQMIPPKQEVEDEMEIEEAPVPEPMEALIPEPVEATIEPLNEQSLLTTVSTLTALLATEQTEKKTALKDNAILKKQLQSSQGESALLKEQLQSSQGESGLLKEQLESSRGDNSLIKEQLDAANLRIGRIDVELALYKRVLGDIKNAAAEVPTSPPA